MNTSGLMKCIGAVAGLGLVSACGGGTTVTPSAGTSAATLTTKYVGRTLFVNGSPVTAARLNALPRYAELVPDASKSGNYEYVFNVYSSYAGIFNYPKSTAMVGQITGAGGQACTNVLYGYGKGIVWDVGRTNNVITEYQVPDKQLKTLPIDYPNTSSCAMNTSGDLAVGVLFQTSVHGGQVVIFKNATGTGKVYQTPLYSEFADGYDPSGNLFADGMDASYHFMLVELVKGSKKFVTIETSNTPEFPGSVQWDGKYVTIFDQLANVTYQYAVKGTKAKLERTIQYTGANDCAQTWIVKGLIYCGDAGNNAAEVFAYPAGGAPLAMLTGNFDLPLGMVAAKK